MRLLQHQCDDNFRLTKDLVDSIQPYAILSHTWGDDDQEVTFQDVKEDTGRHKEGYRKLEFCGKQASSDGLQYFWVDTCCIDKSICAELQEAINSMYIAVEAQVIYPYNPGLNSFIVTVGGEDFCLSFLCKSCYPYSTDQ